MPAAAQAFSKNKKDSLSLSVLMKISQCQACGTVQHVGESVPYFKEAIRSSKFSPKMLDFRYKQFRKFIKKNKTIVSSVFEFGAGEGEHLEIFSKIGWMLQTNKN